MADAPLSTDAPGDPTDADDPSDTVEQHVTLDGDAEAVWDLLTDPELLVGWLGRPDDLDLASGGGGRLIDVDGTERQVRVVEVEPTRAIRWQWWPVGDEGRTTTVEITLEPADPGTEVHVTERSTGGLRAQASVWRVTSFVDVECALLASRTRVASVVPCH